MSIPLKLKQRIIVGSLYVGAIAVALYALYVVGNRMQTRALPSGSIKLTSEYNTYMLGDEIKFTLQNNYNGAIYFDNSCPNEPLEVYRLEYGKWKQIHDKRSAKTCSGERTIKIPGKSSVTTSFKPWKDLFDKAGTYRIVAYVDYYGSLPYDDFEIVEKPTIPEIPALIDIPSSTAQTSNQSTSTSSNSSSSNSTNTSTVTSNTSSNPDSNTPSTKTQTVNVGGGGSISVTYTSTKITVTSVNKPSGYSSYEMSGNNSSQVEITFKSGETEMQVQLSIRNGTIVSRTEIGD